MSARRQLTASEKASLLSLACTLDDVRAVVIQLENLGWKPPHDTRTFDCGAEVICALATDTRCLLVNTPDGWRAG